MIQLEFKLTRSKLIKQDSSQLGLMLQRSLIQIRSNSNMIRAYLEPVYGLIQNRLKTISTNMQMECCRKIATPQIEEIEGKAPKRAVKAEVVGAKCLVTVDAYHTFFVECCLYRFSVS